MKGRVLITGATGLVGQLLGRRLVEKGFDIVALTRTPQHAQMSYPCELVKWDGKTELPPEVVENIQYVIHLAGENIAAERWTDARKQKLWNSRVETTRILVDSFWHRPSPVEAFVCASAVGIYGDRGEEILNEESQPSRDFLARLCLTWEDAAEEFPARRIVNARFGVILSGVGGFVQNLLPIFQQVGASRLSDGKQYVSWVDREDVANALVFLLENPSAKGAYNLTSPKPVTNAQLTEILRSAWKSSPLPAVPKWVLRLQLGEMADAVVSSQRALPERLQRLGYQFVGKDLTETLGRLGLVLEHGEFVEEFESWVPGELGEIWDFFSAEHNLERLTPPFLKFKVLNKSTPRIEQGTKIDYSLKIHHFPVNWTTQIADWKPRESFIDVQQKGPYGKWHHLHEFKPLGSGVFLRDQITYKLPAGWLGRLAGARRVRSDVQKIFAFRTQKMKSIFN